jgi:hypothetical protein
MNRTLRRMMGKEAIQRAASSAAQAGKEPVNADDLNIRGPAVLLNVAGIYT